MEMEEKSSFCANCGQLVQENEIVHHLTLENSQFESNESDLVDIKRALKTIYNLDYIKNSQDEPEVVFVCGQCHPILHNLFKFYDQFNHLREVNSYLDRQIQNLDSILHQIDSQNNNSPLKSEDVDDYLMDDQDAVTLEPVKEEISSSEEDHSDSDDDYHPSDENDMTSHDVGELLHVEIGADDSDDSEEDEYDSSDPLDVSQKGQPEFDPHVHEPISCPLCPLSLQNKTELEIHVWQDHVDKEKMDCPFCDKKFSRAGKFKSHIVRTHLGRGGSPGSLECPRCPRKFNHESHRARHMISVHGEAPEVDATCSICGKVFAKTHYLTIHMRRHRKEMRYPCTFPGCHKAFFGSAELKTHVQRVHLKSTDEISYKCDVCGKGFRSRQGWREHKKTHMDRPFQCPKCRRRFTAQLAHGEHVEKCEGRKSFICDSCGKNFSTKRALDNHMRLHTGNLLACPISNCDKTFTTKPGLDSHVLLHDNSKPIPCLDANCSKKFATKANLKNHLCRLHPHLLPETEVNVKSRLCPVCGVKVVGVASALKKHLQCHNEDRPFKCHLCSKAFKTKHYLEDHVDRHEGRRNFSCSHEGCSKLFYNASELNKHVRIHTGEKNYLCPICGKASSDSSNLKKHMLIHSNDRQFKCQTCDKAFKQPQMLKTHERSHQS